MDRQEIVEHQRREREFRDTEVGAAFSRFESAVANAWVRDTEGTSYRIMDRAWDEHKEARKRLLGLLRPLVGLDPDDK